MRTPTILILATCFAVLSASGETPAKDSKVYHVDEIATASSNGNSRRQAIKRARITRPDHPVKLEKFNRRADWAPANGKDWTVSAAAGASDLKDLSEAKIVESPSPTASEAKQDAVN